MKNAATDEYLFTPADVAELLKISRAMAYIMLRRGDIATIRMGRLVRVRRADLERNIREKAVPVRRAKKGSDFSSMPE